jgi:hypothetical protein
MNYADKLKDPRWQRCRLEILQRDDFTCQKCQDTTTTLHVHHRRYLTGHQPWEYEEHDLVTLCELCHSDEQQLWPDEISNLGNVLSMRGYFASDVNELLIALYEAPGNSQYFLGLISFLSRNKDAYELLSTRFGEWVKSNSNSSGAVTAARPASE